MHEIEFVHVDTLRPNPRNANTHSKKQTQFNLSVRDVKSFYKKYLVWLCWQAAANASPMAKFPDTRENTGNLP